MNKIEKLINQYCPKGVEYKSLRECVLPVDKISWDRNSGEHKYIDLTSVDRDLHSICSFEKINSDNAPSRAQQIIKENDVLLGTTRPMLKRYCIVPSKYDGEICSTGFCVLRPNTEIVLVNWLFHIISSNGFFDYVERHQKGASYPAIIDKEVKSYKLPVPPLEVQREIVCILDNFTKFTSELIVELTAELTARKKQYEYYRNTLLLKKVGKMIRWLKLGEVGKVSMCKRIMKAETSSIGDIPFYKIGTFGGTANSFISKNIFNKYKKEYSYPKKGDVLISAAGTIGRAVIFDGEPAYFQDSNIVWIDNDESVVLNKYLFYYYQLSPWKVSEGGTIPRLYNDNIASTKIVVPSIEEQEIIIDILDRLNMLCDSLATELLSEIETRQKQYGYYCDKLLTFKELSE